MKRRPQARCVCNHAKSKHKIIVAIAPVGWAYKACCYCFSRCAEFKQDNLKTLEVLDAFDEQKKIIASVSL